jgi:hypothetical protein
MLFTITAAEWKVATEKLEQLLRILKFPASNLGSKPTNLTAIFRGFTQFLQTNAGIVS